MNAKERLALAAVGIALALTGCGTVQMTSILDPDHQPAPGQLVLLRFTLKDEPGPMHYAGHRSSESDVVHMDEILIAGK